MTPLSQRFSFRCDTLIGRIKTIIYDQIDIHGNRFQLTAFAFVELVHPSRYSVGGGAMRPEAICGVVKDSKMLGKKKLCTSAALEFLESQAKSSRVSLHHSYFIGKLLHSNVF